MEIYVNRRPSALPAACAQVSAVRALFAAAVPAHAHVGRSAVRMEPITGASLIQAQWAHNGINVSTFDGLAVQQGSAKVKPTAGDVRGVPPRGRPV